jgi:hypothetical protein
MHPLQLQPQSKGGQSAAGGVSMRPTMPTKTHHRHGQPPGIIRTHSRSSSGSKVPLNLHFTQKDSTSPRHVEKSKKASYVNEVRRLGKSILIFVDSSAPDTYVKTRFTSPKGDQLSSHPFQGICVICCAKTCLSQQTEWFKA